MNEFHYLSAPHPLSAFALAVANSIAHTFSFIFRSVHQYRFCAITVPMQITRHVNNKWHKSTFYDRIYEQTINSGAKTGGEKSARK